MRTGFSTTSTQPTLDPPAQATSMRKRRFAARPHGGQARLERAASRPVLPGGHPGQEPTVASADQ